MTSNDIIPLFPNPICVNTFELDDDEIDYKIEEAIDDLKHELGDRINELEADKE